MCRARILLGRQHVIRIAGSYTTAYITNQASKVHASANVAVNGAMEDTSFGSYTFLKLRGVLVP